MCITYLILSCKLVTSFTIFLSFIFFHGNMVNHYEVDVNFQDIEYQLQDINYLLYIIHQYTLFTSQY